MPPLVSYYFGAPYFIHCEVTMPGRGVAQLTIFAVALAIAHFASRRRTAHVMISPCFTIDGDFAFCRSIFARCSISIVHAHYGSLPRLMGWRR
jgi:uncharacterized Rossmann fold enzyme